MQYLPLENAYHDSFTQVTCKYPAPRIKDGAFHGRTEEKLPLHIDYKPCCYEGVQCNYHQ